MAVNFRPNSHFEKFINDLIDSGRYTNKTEVMHAALRSLEDAEKVREARLQNLKNAVQLGDYDIEAGNILAYDKPQDLVEDIKNQGRKKLAQMRKSG